MKASEHGGHVPAFVGMWSYNRPGREVWRNDYFDTKEEAIEAGRLEYGAEAAFEVALFSEHAVAGPDASRILERVSERAYEEAGEIAGEFLCGVPRAAVAELDAELTRVFAAWLTKHAEWPTFGTVERIENVTPAAPTAA